MEHRWRRRTYGCAAALSAAVLTLAGCGAAPGPADAGQGRATHLGSHVSPDDPTQRHLETIRATAGIAAALDELGRVESGAPLLESRPHQRAHLLGSAQFRSLGGDLDSAFRGCDMRFQGGCHHGVLQEYFRSRPPIDGGSLRGLCDRLAAGSAPVVHASCVHGVGHGLFAYFDETLAGPLSRCGQLVAAEQNECRGGVFMENLVVS